MKRTTIALALIYASPAAASAQSPSHDDARPTEFVFNDELVAGDYHSSGAEQFRVRRRLGRHTLIQPRLHFVPELQESVEDL